MMAVLVMLERLEKRQRGASGSVSSSNLSWNSLCFVVSCFSAASSRERLQRVSIGLFRSSWAIWSEDRRHRRHKGQTSYGGAARDGSRATYACLGPGGPLQYFFISGFFLCKKFHARKSSVNLSSGRSLKHQNTQKRCFLFRRVITKIRG
jgi:hypothetical protein